MKKLPNLKNLIPTKKNLTNTLNNMVDRLLHASYFVAKVHDLTCLTELQFKEKVLEYLRNQENEVNDS